MGSPTVASPWRPGPCLELTESSRLATRDVASVDLDAARSRGCAAHRTHGAHGRAHAENAQSESQKAPLEERRNPKTEKAKALGSGKS